MKHPQKAYDLIIVGGGAAGVFAAIRAKTLHPSASVCILERSEKLLSKVSLSGGGRCNVTNACFDPKKLIENYPRGSKELLGPFHAFQPKDMIAWLENHGVPLREEALGRVFPVSNTSESIINCLTLELKNLSIHVRYNCKITSIEKKKSLFEIACEDETFLATNLLLATGSHPQGYAFARALGHTIIPPVPSLFPLKLTGAPFREISGITIDPVSVSIPHTKIESTGALLLTHSGVSGPAALKLSAFGARYLSEQNYKETIIINWLPGRSQEEIANTLLLLKEKPTLLCNEPFFSFPKRLWKFLISSEKKCRDLSLKEIKAVAEKLHRDVYHLEGRDTHHDEFVTCGGISLREIDFRTMKSKICDHLFLAGEILDIDGITGGFNLQNAWTTGYIAGGFLE